MIAHGHVRDVAADFEHDAGRLVAEHARRRHGQGSLDHVKVAVTNTAGCSLDPDLPGSGVAELIERAIEAAIEQKRVTYDFHRQMEGATKVSCSGFGDVLIENIQKA